jgi:hypothetical protein
MYGQNANTAGTIGNRPPSMAEVEAKQRAYSQQQDSTQPYRSSEGQIKEICERFEYLERLSQRLNVLADRACGMPPGNTKLDGAPTPSPDCLSGKLALISQAAGMLCDRFEGSINRLDTFV